MPTVEINLLPPQFKPLPPYSVRNLVGVILSTGLLAFLLVLSLHMINAKADYSAHLTDLEQKLNSSRKQRKEIIELQKRAAAMKIYLEFLDDIMKQRITWVGKLTDVNYRVPSGLWLTEITMERKKIEAPAKAAAPPAESGQTGQTGQTGQEGEKKTAEKQVEPKTELILLHLAGDAYSMDQISKFMSNLDESMLFENTKLLQVVRSEADEEKPAYISFKVDTELETPKKPEAEAEKPENEENKAEKAPAKLTTEVAP